ncbi:hypothetical protein COCHEDRAFT_1182566 [Bipolaris maydis C5]|uniref:Uncharacterized protein n=1 Tax=Cochliobolus heterostrophus (strain C5 / ATCC 48332 / race O) TaxID=701091 RepID=M2UIE7_COCH5|nr:hypothetical protein COCHEDRAFT_1182566 [Bipolaris maydis C5]KAJ6206713.1 hypothetical protein PSV09DRAFT_1182566 [Bipolaris maydis]KAJ6268754.1 hypothetical protein PSV08DRAFT_379144 [Bipolaris maydis]
MEPGSEPESRRRGSRQSDESTSTASSHNNDSRDERNIIYLTDHLGVRYGAEPFLREIYAKYSQSYLDRITKDDYVIKTQGATILPSVWAAIMRPRMNLQIEFPQEEFYSEVDYRQRPSSRSRTWSPARFQRDVEQDDERDDERDDVHDINDNIRTVTFEDGSRWVPPLPRRETDLDSNTDSSESVTSTSDQESLTEQAELPEPPREVVAPMDLDGNQLSFQVDTRRVQNLIGFSQDLQDQKDDTQVRSKRKDVDNYRVDTFRITKAMIKETQGHNQLQVHVLPGPENPHLQDAVSLTWCHISATQLDFSRFKDVCLTMPHASDRLRKLTSEMLTKVDTEKVKPFDGGMFIEPGTVLRADESNQSDPQSVIFACVPYFALDTQAKKPLRAENDLFPQRTLMQTFYPYEPVRDRDEEQSYRRFDDARSENIIHVPNIWFMIIGSNHVVSCGHVPLSKEMTNSMAIIQENVKKLGVQPVADNDLTMIKFSDWGERDFVFPLSTCRSYFQMEAKVRMIGYMFNNKSLDAEIHLLQKFRDSSCSLTPNMWRDITARNDLLSISLAVAGDKETGQTGKHTTAAYCAGENNKSRPVSVPPFFHWPQHGAGKAIKDDKDATSVDDPSAQQPSRCLEQVGKALMSTILEGTTTNAVDETFTSTNYYESLPKATYADACADFANLKRRCEAIDKGTSDSTFHQDTINGQRTSIVERATEFFNLSCIITKLFLRDTDDSSIMSKLWGVMVKIQQHVAKLEKYTPRDGESGKGAVPPEEDVNTTGKFWLVRPMAKPSLVSFPESRPELAKSIAACKTCKRLHSFRSQEDAFRHLQRHINRESEPGKRHKGGEPTTSEDIAMDPQAKDWIMASAEFWHEQTNAGTLAILTKACTLAKNIMEQAQQLMDGVQNEDGQMSELYTLPKELSEAFRRIIVLFMATERALDDADKAHGHEFRFKDPYERSILPYSDRGLDVLERFEAGAMQSLRAARAHLCEMASSPQPRRVMEHLSRGPQYICGELTRRLLLKPLEKHETVGDLYREYISRLQFQVNHHPSKRLLRDLNLLQEELQILTSITMQQLNLIKNYIRVLNDASYEKPTPSRQSMFVDERSLLQSCLDSLSLVVEDYEDLIRRCSPLANRTKQSLEINDEDHGKAIMAFTVVTVIFLPLSFATSYFGMNTADIRDMNQKQGLFWIVAIPLTIVTVGACLFIGYNGDQLRDMISWLYRRAMGKEETGTGGGGISVPRRKRPPRPLGDSSSTLQYSNVIDEAPFAIPRPALQWGGVAHSDQIWVDADEAWYTERYDPPVTKSRFDSRSGARMESYAEPISMAPEASYRIHRHHEYIKTPRGRTYDPYTEAMGRVRYDYNEEDTYLPGARHALPGRQTYVSPGSFRAEMPIRKPSGRRYNIDELKDDKAGGYTWEKKRPHRSHGDHRRTRSERLAERSWYR